MADFIGKNVQIKTENGILSGRLTSINKDEGKVTLEDSYNISNELDLLSILEVQLIDPSENNDLSLPTLKESGSYGELNEERMQQLFNDAFNIYGPFEDNFCCTIALALKKFIRDASSAKIKIVIGSDDVFGRIGLCFARMMLGRVLSLEVEQRCDIKDFKTLKYTHAFENSGGNFNASSSSHGPYTMLLFACNRHSNFDTQKIVSNNTIVLDVPPSLPFAFIGFGLGFKPENYSACSKFYYLVDAGYSLFLCDKYKIPRHFKNSLTKEYVN